MNYRTLSAVGLLEYEEQLIKDRNNVYEFRCPDGLVCRIYAHRMTQAVERFKAAMHRRKEEILNNRQANRRVLEQHRKMESDARQKLYQEVVHRDGSFQLSLF